MKATISPSKSAINYAVIFGIIMITQFVTMYALSIQPQENPIIGTIINILNYLILPFIFIYLASNNFKTKINKGYISMGEVIKIGLTICSLSALIYGIFYLLFDFIVPEFREQLLEQIAQVTVNQNPSLSSEQLKMSMKFVEIFMNPYIVIPFTIVMYCVIGLIHSLIVGAILKNNKPLEV
jgi:hypothetical protein